MLANTASPPAIPSPEEPAARFLRVSDAEREHVIGQLQRTTG
jgi:hypothetical protein